MLNDAYQVPAVPRTLLRRLDRAVEQEWGVSPELAKGKPSRVGRVAARGSRVLKAWPIAATLALIVVAVVMFQSNSRAYGWAKMLDALRSADVVQIADANDGSVRWMSLSKAVVGERSKSESRLFDFGRGIMLEREAGASQAERYTFVSAKGTSQQEAMLIALLLDNLNADGTAFRQSDMAFLSEKWSRSDGDEVLLEVKLGSPTAVG